MQRVNLTTCLGASLVNTLFVMDEPSVGLHPRDVGRLVRVMHNLRDKGNTLLVVEHEEAIIRAADQLDRHRSRPRRARRRTGLQRPARQNSGWIGRSAAMQRKSRSDQKPLAVGLTSPASGRSTIAHARLSHRRKIDPDSEIAAEIFARDQDHRCERAQSQEPRCRNSARHFHLRDRRFRFRKIDSHSRCALPESAARRGAGKRQEPGACKSVTGAHRVGEIVMVDQAPLARTPRSTPILYLGLYDRVRELFAAQPEAMAQGLTASAFSFNSGSGRCERCCGTGFEKIEMQFLSDLYVRCAECEGRRFQPHVLKVQAARQIDSRRARADGERSDRSFSRRSAKQKTLARSARCPGGGRARLSAARAAAQHFSGGESQRLKLVRHLSETGDRMPKPERSAKANLFIFDEPTTGLHFDDVAMLREAVSAPGRSRAIRSS